MFDTRRSFLQSAAAIAAAVPGAAAAAQRQIPTLLSQPPVSKPLPPAPYQVPRIRLGKTEVGRVVCGCNPIYGFGHFNQTLSALMTNYYTAERVCDVLHRCNQVGINAFNYVTTARSQKDLEMFRAQGGKMHLICQGTDDVPGMVKAIQPLAVYRHGGRTDTAFMQGRIDEVREWCKMVRGLGVMVGVGTHRPEVVALVEEQNWDIDFYATCVYKVTRTREELKEALGGEIVEMPNECYVQSDPARMYKAVRSTKKPCFAFKILAAGRVTDYDAAFRTAFESIKPGDGVFVGLFPCAKDEIRDNAERVQRVLRKG
jgi:hypothetical protein